MKFIEKTNSGGEGGGCTLGDDVKVGGLVAKPPSHFAS